MSATPVVLPARRLLLQDPEEEADAYNQSLRSQTECLVTVINALAPGYDAAHLGSQARRSEARLQQISSHLLQPASSSADPALKDCEARARAVDRTKFTPFARCERLNRMERMLDANVTATLVEAGGEALGKALSAVGEAARTLCKMTPVGEDCDKKAVNRGISLPTKIQVYFADLSKASQEGFNSLKEENLKLDIPAEMTEQFAKDAMSVSVAGMTLGVGNKLKSLAKAELRVTLRNAALNHHQLMKQEKQLVTFLEGTIPPLVPPRYFPENINQFLLSPLEHSFAKDGLQATLLYQHLENHFLFVILNEARFPSPFRELIKKSTKMSASEKVAILVHEAVDFANLHGKKALIGANSSKLPLMKVLAQSERPIEVLSMGALGERYPFTVAEVALKKTK